MTDEAVSPLRRRMIEDMTIRKFAPETQHYAQRVENFAASLGRSPDAASFEDVWRYQLHPAASGVGVPTIKRTVSTLRKAGGVGGPLPPSTMPARPPMWPR
jgi:integrase/recombinase XerD